MSYSFFAFFLFFLSSNAIAGVGELYLDVTNISCSKNSPRLVPSLIGLNQSLIEHMSQVPIEQNELSTLEQKSLDPRADLETWIYIQNAARKIISTTNTKYLEFSLIKIDLENNKSNEQVDKWRSAYTLLLNLYREKKILEKTERTCSKWRFWNVFERSKNKDLCKKINSPHYEESKTHQKSAINKLELAFPLFFHPLFQKKFISSPETSDTYDSLIYSFITESIPELEKKAERYQVIGSQQMTAENILTLLSDKQVLSDTMALKYSPKDRIFKDKEDKNLLVSLASAECRVHQKFHAIEMNELSLDFGKDVALLLSPFAIRGKIASIVKSAKGAQKLVQLKLARQGFIAAEGSYILVETADLKRSEDKCNEITRKISKTTEVPDSLIKEEESCRELRESIATSYALAVVGGMVAIKLSKLDLNDIRLQRIAQQGKQKLYETNAIVKATLIKQSDIIHTQLESLIATNRQEPQLAYAHSSENTQLSVSTNLDNSTQTAKLSKREKKKKKKKSPKKEKQSQKTTLHKDPLSEFDELVDEAVHKITCYKDKTCKTKLIFLTPGLKKLARSPKIGRKITQYFIDYFNKEGYDNIPNTYRLLIEECLKITKKELHCSPNQFRAIAKMTKKNWKTPPNPHYLNQILKSLKYDQSIKKLNRSLYLLSEHTSSKQGSIIGALNGVQFDGKNYLIDNQIVPSSERTLYQGLYHEDQAIRSLSKLGFKVETIPETKEMRAMQGIQGRFLNITKLDNIAPNRSPDIILNNDYIADIYSPKSHDTKESLEYIVEGVLFKSESRNFRRSLTDITHRSSTGRVGPNYAKRQTSRVIIYLDSFKGDAENISQELNRLIGEKRPEHLQEAFIIYKKDGNSHMQNVWP